MRLRRGLGLIAALVLAGQAARAQPAVWTVHGRGGDIVLFGSVHLLPEGLDWRPPALLAALKSADEVWFELPIDDATAVGAQTLSERRGRLPPGQSLWGMLTAGQRARLERACRDLGVAPEALTPLRPWMAELSLSLADDARAGAKVAQGVEARLQLEAPASVRRRAFESVRQQIGFLAGAAMSDQVASLDETAREMIDDPELYPRTVKAWMSADMATLAREDLDPLAAAAPNVYRRLIVERNRRWARTVGHLARAGTRAVVVVGAGHMVGRDGLPAILRRQGYAVDGP